MPDLTFTGERFLPACSGEIAYEHWHRYAFARRFASGRRVLDAACGEGYGAALLAATAEHVTGIDIDGATIRHARERYRDPRLEFLEGSCIALPLADASVDVVVSFETIEHLPASGQPAMLAEFDRVLKPDGVVVISSPNKRLYSDVRSYVNEFHLHELYRDDFERMLAAHFPAMEWFHQRVATWSGIWPEREGPGAEAWIGGAEGVRDYDAGEGLYFVVVAARSEASLPAPALRVSLLSDAEDSEGRRAAGNAAEVLRLDALLREVNATVARQAAHVQHLEQLVATREQSLGEAQGRLNAATGALEGLRIEHEHAVTALGGEVDRLHGEVRQLERTVSDRQSARWWLKLPWLRLRHLLGGRAP
jgi:SAM-dependent methyltransferase